MGPGEIVSTHAMLGLGMADDRLDRRTAAEFAFDRLGDAASLARDIDLELVVGRSVVAAIAAVGDDAREVRALICVSISGITVREGVAVVELPVIALAWAINWPPLERWSVVASETLTPNS